MAVRNTLKKHGRQSGIHMQIVLHEWQPGLPFYVVALQSAVRNRLERLDPQSRTWMTGGFWRFDPKDWTKWPQLPAPGQPRTGLPDPRTKEQTQAPASWDNLLVHGVGNAEATGTEFSPTIPMNMEGR
jgi:hypothetical protein